MLTLAVVAVAIAGKLVGTMLAYPFSSLSLRQLMLVGWGMNSRGVIELVIANIALSAGLIDSKLYSAIVFMSIVTTLIFPLAIKSALRKDPTLMD